MRALKTTLNTSICYTAARVSPEVFIKDPASSELGRRLLDRAVLLIDQNGFESFNFKKLSEEVGSPESTLYRYFKNKQNLLIYLEAWYWSVMECKVTLRTANIEDPAEILERAFSVLTERPERDSVHSFLDERALRRIVVSESIQSYYAIGYGPNEAVDGVVSCKHIVDRLAETLKSKYPDYPFMQALVYTIIEAVHEQLFFLARHPEMTDVTSSDDIRIFAVTTILSNLEAHARLRITSP